jgi:hypothetical protein
MNPTAFPALLHPKHLYIPLAGDTVNEPVFSLWKGQRPIRLAPCFLSVTYRHTTSSIFAVSKILLIVSLGIIFLVISLEFSVFN